MNTVEGLPELLKKFVDLQTNGLRMADAVVGSIADGVVLDAKQSAPADLGKIRQGIGKESVSSATNIMYKIFSSAPESAFQEFGTGGRVIIPPEMSDVAAQFQGQKGGDFAEFIKALVGWVRRHGLTGVYSVKTHKRIGTKASNADADEQAAYLIARSILKNGLKPQPFLYPAYVRGTAKLIPAFEKGIQDLIFSFNNNQTFTSDSEFY